MQTPMTDCPSPPEHRIEWTARWQIHSGLIYAEGPLAPAPWGKDGKDALGVLMYLDKKWRHDVLGGIEAGEREMALFHNITSFDRSGIAHLLPSLH